MSLEGTNGTGQRLTEDEVMFSIKIFTQSNNKEEEDYEVLAQQVGFNLSKAADSIVSECDPE